MVEAIIPAVVGLIAGKAFGGKGGGSAAPAPAASTPAAPATPTPPAAPAPVTATSAASGPAETAAAETATKGRRATIMTTPQGLLVGQESPELLRQRRSLVGGGLIK